MLQFGEQIIKRQTPIEVDEVSYVPGIKDAKPKIDPKKFIGKTHKKFEENFGGKVFIVGDSTLPQNLLSQTSHISKTLGATLTIVTPNAS